VAEMFLVMGHGYSYTDLDSIISSVIFAELWTAGGHPAKAVLINPKGIKETTVKILEKIGNIDLPEIVTKTELENSNLILVDHNNPEESYGKLGINKTPYIIIDHHQDIGLSAVHKIIERVGSTCTLITEFGKAEGLRLTERQARALAFGILSDTRGLKGRKTSERDIKAIQFLYNEYDIPESVDTISEMVLKTTNIQSMSVRNILRNSLKEYQNGSIGIAAIEVADNGYQERMGEILSYGDQMGYGLYILMIIKYHAQETEILYFDSDFLIFPKRECRTGLVSRALDLAPEILNRVNNFARERTKIDIPTESAE
jgi:inorganic pyrophosphatase/exopolyphosphatase